MPVIGLIGGIGAGKSRVAALLAARGAQVLDADAIGHALLEQTPSRDEVVARFGAEVLERDGSGLPIDPPRVDRAALGRIVFAEPASLKALEAILHPRMRQTFAKAIARVARKRSAPAVVLDAAVLLEARWHDLCDLIVYVDAPTEVRLARLQASRGWTAETLAARERAQRPTAEKRGRADFVLENASDEEALAAAVDPLWAKLTRGPLRPSAAKPGRPLPSPTDPA